MSLVTVTVTAEDIQSGRPQSAKGCPNALAASRVIPLQDGEVSFGWCFRTFSTFDANGHYVRRWLAPESARDFVYAFDSLRGGPRAVRPYEFQMREIARGSFEWENCC